MKSDQEKLAEAIDDLKHQVWQVIEQPLMRVIDSVLKLLRFMRVL